MFDLTRNSISWKYDMEYGTSSLPYEGGSSSTVYVR
jgi:hypothetical protein